jgi:succinate-semialdehyde dehydrogenase/glutarate-semialdehyde dehydrogenase
MTVEDARGAIQGANTAFKAFSKTTLQYRADLLEHFYALLWENAANLTRIVTYENGKSLSDAKAKVAYAASW